MGKVTRVCFGRRLLAGVGSLALVAACSGSDAGDGEGGDEPLPLGDNACASLGKIHRIANCDGCTRDLCCDVVQECTQSRACNGAIRCLANCAKEDRECSSTCLTDNAGGETLLADVDKCARAQCPVPCETAQIQE